MSNHDAQIPSTDETIYLDHAATTPMDPQAIEAMVPYLGTSFGNASSLYKLGRTSRKALDEAREIMAAGLRARPLDIVFTSGGTESDNAALCGVIWARQNQAGPKTPIHIITSQIEHHAILHTCEFLERWGVEVTYLSVDQDGLVDPAEVERAIRPETALVSIMLANNEVGTIQPIAAIAAIAHRHGVLMHTDAVQAAGMLDLNVQELGVDLLSLSAHKFYGPKGTGILYIRRGTTWSPVQHGGSQERGRRAGTENVAGIVGMATAFSLALARRETIVTQCRTLRDYLYERINATIPDIRLNGHPDQRLPNNLNVSFRGVEGESILLNLDRYGIAASSGSACTAGSIDPSHVLKALGVSASDAIGAVRFTVGRSTTLAQTERVVEVLAPIVTKLRQVAPVGV